MRFPLSCFSVLLCNILLKEVKAIMHHWAQPYERTQFLWTDGIVGLLITIAFWVAVVFLVAVLIKSFKEHNNYKHYEDGGFNKALEILKERYAKGEINKKVFEEMKKDVL